MNAIFAIKVPFSWGNGSCMIDLKVTQRTVERSLDQKTKVLSTKGHAVAENVTSGNVERLVVPIQGAKHVRPFECNMG